MFGAKRSAAFNSAARADYYRGHLSGLTAHERHVKLVADYQAFYAPRGGGGAGGAAAEEKHTRHAAKLVETDLSALQAGHRFIRSEDDDREASWEARLAARYYQRLFKEYCIADLSRYKDSKLGLRWRTEREVVAGKGQFVCGTKGCDETAGLCSYEVNFAYSEAGERKQALVKLRVCPMCAYKLNYKREKEFRMATSGGGSEGGGRSGASKRGATSGDGGDGKRTRIEEAEALLRQAASGGGSGSRRSGPSDSGDGGQMLERPGSFAPPPAKASSDAPGAGPPAAALLPDDDSVWEHKPAVIESTAEEDMDQYFEGLFA